MERERCHHADWPTGLEDPGEPRLWSFRPCLAGHMRKLHGKCTRRSIVIARAFSVELSESGFHAAPPHGVTSPTFTGWMVQSQAPSPPFLIAYGRLHRRPPFGALSGRRLRACLWNAGLAMVHPGQEERTRGRLSSMSWPSVYAWQNELNAAEFQATLDAAKRDAERFRAELVASLAPGSPPTTPSGPPGTATKIG